MPEITGSVYDVGLTGSKGTLWISAGFRTGTSGVIAPRRVPYSIVDGQLPANVVVEPGPAVLEIDVGVDARGEWPVVIPAEDVTLRELFATVYQWTPEELSAFAQLRADAIAAAERAETAAEGVDASIAGAAAQVVAEVEQDRVAAETAAGAADQSARDAATSQQTAGKDADTADRRATAAGQSEANAKISETNADLSEQAAAGSAATASQGAQVITDNLEAIEAAPGHAQSAQTARTDAEDARDAAGRSEAESTRQAGLAADHADGADASRRAAGLSETNAGLSEQAAAGHEAQALAARDDARTYRDESRTARDGSVSAAGASATARDEAAGSTAAASGHAVTAGNKAEQAALSAQTAEQIAQQVIDALANAQAYQDVVTAIGGMSADWQQDIADAIAALVGQAPETLATLEGLATALGDDPNYATSTATEIGKKVDKTDPRLSDARTPTTHQHGLADLPAVAAALDEKSDKGHSHEWSQISHKPTSYPPTAHNHTKAEVGLGNVDDTSDADKPVSTAQAAAIGAKADTSFVESRPAMWLWSGTGTWSPPAAANSGDSVLNLDSGEIHSITEV